MKIIQSFKKKKRKIVNDKNNSNSHNKNIHIHHIRNKDRQTPLVYKCVTKSRKTDFIAFYIIINLNKKIIVHVRRNPVVLKKDSKILKILQILTYI